jgi:signal transduction histidine kinase
MMTEQIDMANEDELRDLLREIRDNQKQALNLQRQHLDYAKQQLERSRTQVAESIGLQREAIAKTRLIMAIAIPGIVLCIGLIFYLLARYF